MTGVALLAVVAGITALYSGIKGVDPRSLFTGVFTGQPPTPLPALPSSSSAVGTTGSNPTSTPITGGNPPAASGVTPAAQNWMKKARVHFPQIASMQVWNCSMVPGTSVWSQHAFGNAVDNFSDPATMEALFHWAIANKQPLSLHTVIYNHRVWDRERPYIHPYTGTNPHTDHVHADFDPQGQGTPPCASGKVHGQP